MRDFDLREIFRLHEMWLRDEKGGQRANFSSANLYQANLIYQDLARVDFFGANLIGAELFGAKLAHANFGRALLARADFTDADLTNADFANANLTRANLARAILTCAYLSRADLTGVDLRAANLTGIKDDFLAAILYLPAEVPFLRQALLDGKIDGSSYRGECACLAGTMAHACGMAFDEFKQKVMMPIDPDSPREVWFRLIREGDTPESSQAASITLEWIDEAMTGANAMLP